MRLLRRLLLRSVFLHHTLLNLSLMGDLILLSGMDAILHICHLRLHPEVLEANVFFSEFNAETASVVVERSFVLSFENLLADLAMTSVEVVCIYGWRVLKVNSSFKFVAQLILPSHRN